MAHVDIIYTILLFCAYGVSTQTTETSLTASKPKTECPTIGFGKKCIYKCCPFRQHMQRKLCLDYDKWLDFSAVSVYSESLVDTGKKVQDMFTILDDKFVREPSFYDNSMNRDVIGYTPYVLEVILSFNILVQ